MAPTAHSNIQLQFSPSPPSHFRQTAIIQCLAFSNNSLSRYWSATKQDMSMRSVEDIPPLRLYLTERDHHHRELDPTSFVVTALIDGVVVGCASWQPPKALWRTETLMELLYRKAIQAKDKVEDWFYPATLYLPAKREEFHHAQEETMAKILGEHGIEDMWYLKILCTSPGYQRQGIGAILVDWGLNHARVRGEKVYLEASEFGKGLYIKKGFKEVGKIVLSDGVTTLPCLLWDPEMEKQVKPQQADRTIANL